MKRLDEAVNKYFENDFEFSDLLTLIEEQLDNSSSIEINEEAPMPKFSGARFYKTALKSFKAPTEQAGKLGTEERKTFQKYIARNVRGDTLADKITSINNLVSGQTSGDPKISEIMGTLGAVKMLQQTLDDFNESTAGFLFEAFLSGLLGGKQVTDRVGGTLPIEDCMFFVDPKTGAGGQPVSLKLLSPRTTIEGSLANLLDFFARPDIAAVAEEKGIEYIVATKTARDELDVYSFNIKPSNFFYWVEEKHFDLKKYARDSAQDTIMEAKTPEDIERSKDIWEKAFLGRAPMFGLDPSEVDFNYEWRTASRDWRRIVKPPTSSSSSKAAKEALKKIAQIMVSDASKQLYARWRSSDLMVPTSTEELEFENTNIEMRLNSEDPSDSLLAAKQLAIIGKKRLIAYFNSIEGVQAEKFRESPVHIQRWWAVNKRGEQHVESDVVQKLKDLMQDGSPESIAEWSRTLKSVLLDAQFDINPIRVRSEGTLYGTIDVSKKKIYRSLQMYSDQLAELCFPIYDELEKLSKFINGYFLQNRVKDAFSAAGSAKNLSTHTDSLAKKVEK